MDMLDLIEGLVNDTVETEKINNVINKPIDEIYVVGKVNKYKNVISEVIEGCVDEDMAAVKINELSKNNENGTSIYGYQKINIIKNQEECNSNEELNVNVLVTSFGLSVKEIRIIISVLENFLSEEEKQPRQFDSAFSKLQYQSELNDIKKLIDKYKYAQHFSEQHLNKMGGSAGKRKENQRIEKELSRAGIFNYG